MDVQALLNSVNESDRDDIEVRLYLSKKINRREFETFRPGIGYDLQIELLEMALTSLGRAVEIEQREYSPIGTIAGTIEFCEADEVSNLTELLNSFEPHEINPEIENGDIKDLNFYCLRVNLPTEDENIYIFRRITKFKKLQHGFMGKFVDGDFEKISSELLGIDNQVDVVIFRGEMLILNHIALERIFSIEDQFFENAEVTLSIVEDSNRITNFDQFREDCLSDGRVVRALTKILKEEDRLEQSFLNFNNMIKAVNIFELDINFNDDNTALIYEDKSQLMDVVRLIRDSFYRSIVNERDGIDEGV
ncbi:Kiwa anti-phage protein KwaB-like domain-containing protein [Alkalicoccobacillus plakortidis]|uniref:DUF4868 domain-containing protein n=1 Tax=Alkalicoccobacillus plakortidis TaxID=444060 RepID=A0ABT0XI55_9BACI|nr:Kiwa anti-phage protein KwaB-like domain-containing protein [Alkalicoccobacillus plakortidis]MCM2675591.1 DUF4868 domain-containing protein [Alkalicoccobacillus plakortidis]